MVNTERILTQNECVAGTLHGISEGLGQQVRSVIHIKQNKAMRLVQEHTTFKMPDLAKPCITSRSIVSAVPGGQRAVIA
jgi:hypothetical protein